MNLLEYGDTATLNAAPPGPSPINIDDMDAIRARWPLLLKYDPETGLLLRRYVLLSAQSRDSLVPQQYTATRQTVVGNRALNMVSVDGYRVEAAKVVWLLHHGSWPPRKLRRLDGSYVNDRIDNLALSDEAERRGPLRKRPVGVAKLYDRWQAYVRFPDGRQIRLGTFKTEEDAVAARKRWDDGQDLV